MSAQPKPLPCPWCERTDVFTEPFRGGKHFANCFYCGAQGPVEDGVRQALASWNNRVGEAELTKLRERVPKWAANEQRCTIGGEDYCPVAELDAAVAEQARMLDRIGSGARFLLDLLQKSNDDVEAMYNKSDTLGQAAVELRSAVRAWEDGR